MSSLNNRFARAVRQLRAARGWSQERLAESASLNRSYVGEIERGTASPSLLTADKLARALGIKLSALVAHCEGNDPPLANTGRPSGGYSMLNGHQHEA